MIFELIKKKVSNPNRDKTKTIIIEEKYEKVQIYIIIISYIKRISIMNSSIDLLRLYIAKREMLNI